jgi:hypothetical protein
MFVGLVSDPRWEPPEGFPPHEPHREWHVPWRELAWIALFWAGLLLIPTAQHLLGTLAAYLLLLLVLAVGAWRLNRWCSRVYWRGMKDYQQ